MDIIHEPELLEQDYHPLSLPFQFAPGKLPGSAFLKEELPDALFPPTSLDAERTKPAPLESPTKKRAKLDGNITIQHF